jgi:membrane-bound metal-dependent hydrolase YbcI (DUF457 family)
MYAAHFGAGLAIKSRVWNAPSWALLLAAFLPDILWVPLATLGVESQPAAWHDDWSHSLFMTLVWATMLALLFIRRGRAVAAAVWLAVFSHFLLDLPIHPKDLALYPHSTIHLGMGLWSIGRFNYWLVETCILIILMIVYARGARRHKLPMTGIAGTCLLVLALHARFFLPF